MREDLLEAKACIDWAEAQVPTLAARIEAWNELSPYEIVPEFDSQHQKNALKFNVRHPLPRIVSAEAGVIIHMVRSSLDLLTVSLAKRNGHSNPKNVYFPISASRAAFLDDRNGGLKKIKQLSAKDIHAIKDLRPYRGGNSLLYAIHYFDVERKHRQLLRAKAATEQWSFWGVGIDAEFPDRPVFDVEHGAVLAWISPEAAHHDLLFQVEATLREPHIFAAKPVISALNEFAGLARSIIKLFD